MGVFNLFIVFWGGFLLDNYCLFILFIFQNLCWRQIAANGQLHETSTRHRFQFLSYLLVDL